MGTGVAAAALLPGSVVAVAAVFSGQLSSSHLRLILHSGRLDVGSLIS